MLFMNLPTKLTVTRIILAIVVMILLIFPFDFSFLSIFQPIFLFPRLYDQIPLKWTLTI